MIAWAPCVPFNPNRDSRARLEQRDEWQHGRVGCRDDGYYGPDRSEHDRYGQPDPSQDYACSRVGLSRLPAPARRDLVFRGIAEDYSQHRADYGTDKQSDYPQYQGSCRLAVVCLCHHRIVSRPIGSTGRGSLERVGRRLLPVGWRWWSRPSRLQAGSRRGRSRRGCPLGCLIQSEGITTVGTKGGVIGVFRPAPGAVLHPSSPFPQYDRSPPFHNQSISQFEALISRRGYSPPPAMLLLEAAPAPIPGSKPGRPFHDAIMQPLSTSHA